MRTLPLAYSVLALTLWSASPALAQSTARVSVNSLGVGGDDFSEKPSISGNGRFTVFHSDAANLVPGDTNFARDIFLHDAVTGETRRISVNSSGAQADAGSNYTAISSDGRFVVLQSDATNLVPSDTNFTSDVFIHEILSGQTTLISTDSAGIQGNNRSDDPTVSANGRFIAFHSDASNLAAGDFNSNRDIFLHDRQTAQTSILSVTHLGNSGNGRSDDPAISSDGRFVAFWSEATDLVPADTNGFSDVFLHDQQSGNTILISTNSTGGQGDQDSNYPCISSDGRLIAFHSDASNLVLGDGNGGRDIFIHDRLSGQTTLVSRDTNGIAGNNMSADPSISADGRYIAFWSAAANLVPGDTNNDWDVFVRDLQLGVTSRVSIASNGSQALSGSSFYPSISSDGRYVAFQSDASNLVAGDLGNRDIFVHDRGFSLPQLSRSGSCPGMTALSISNGTPNSLIAIIYGPAGSFMKSTPPCAGITVEIAGPILGALIPADSSGQAVLNFPAPTGACGRTVQAVDIASCTTTNTIVL